MTKRIDWLPRNHEALYSQAVQTQTYMGVPANRTRMGFGTDTPQGKWFDTVFADAFSAYDTLHAQWANEPGRTPLITIRFKAAEKAFKPVYRQLYNGLLRKNPLVTDDDLHGMGLPERPGGGSHPSPVPTTIPSSTVVLPSPAVVEIHFRDADSDHKAKPDGVHGAEIAWSLLATPPENWEELTHSSFDTHTPMTLTFERDQRGKTLYFALRWENTRGEKGPWSDIQSAVIG